MSSLTETASLMRTLFKILAVLILIIIAGFYAYRYLSTTLFKQKEEVLIPTLGFGKLPPPHFPDSTLALPELTLETVAKPEDFRKVATVHALVNPKLTFRSKEQAIAKARNMSFISTPEQLSTEELLFTDDQLPLRTLTYNLPLGQFSLKYDYTRDPTVFTHTNTFEEATLIDHAQTFFLSAQSLPQPLGEGNKTIEYFIHNSGQLVPANRSAEADAARVNLFRTPIDGLSVVYGNPLESTTYVTFTLTNELKKQVIEANYAYYDINERNETYPTIDYLAAYELLKSGKGYIAQSDGSQRVTITEVTRAYYENDNTFLYPIYIFNAEGFTAYVSAIADDQFKAEPKKASSSPGAVRGASTENAAQPSRATVTPQRSGLHLKTQPPKFSDFLAN